MRRARSRKLGKQKHNHKQRRDAFLKIEREEKNPKGRDKYKAGSFARNQYETE